MGPTVVHGCSVAGGGGGTVVKGPTVVHGCSVVGGGGGGGATTGPGVAQGLTSARAQATPPKTKVM